MQRRRWWAVAALSSLALVAVGTAEAKPKKKKKGADVEQPAPGWWKGEGMLAACWYPPTFDGMGAGERRMSRDETLQAMLSQWKGQRDDGVQLKDRVVDDVETILLGFPDKIEAVAAGNFDQCVAAMKGGGTDAWDAWLLALPKQLVKGECRRPLDDTMFWYLDIGAGWQGGTSVCEGDPVRIYASATDEYRVDDDGPWINATGDRDRPAMGNEFPCHLEGCYHGQLVLRFRGESGVEVIKPIDLDITFTPPEHGTIEFTVNDTSYFNNVWKVVRGVQHRTSVTYEPIE